MRFENRGSDHWLQILMLNHHARYQNVQKIYFARIEFCRRFFAERFALFQEAAILIFQLALRSKKLEAALSIICVPRNRPSTL